MADRRPTMFESSLLASPASIIVDRRREYFVARDARIPKGAEAYDLFMNDLDRRRLKGQGIQLSLWRPRPKVVGGNVLAGPASWRATR